MAEPEKRVPWGALLLVSPLVLLMIGLLAVAGGHKGAFVGVLAAVLVFSILLATVWRAGLLGGRKAAPVTPTVIAALFSGMILVLVLAVLVLILK